MAGDIKSSYEDTTYPKEVNNWDHSALGTAQPAGNMIKKTFKTLQPQYLQAPIKRPPI